MQNMQNMFCALFQRSKILYALHFMSVITLVVFIDMKNDIKMYIKIIRKRSINKNIQAYI